MSHATPTNDIWDDAPSPTSEEAYKALLRALRRKRGFGILFVECSPAEGQRIIQLIHDDLPTKTMGELVFKDAIDDGNVYQRVKQVLTQHPVDILFIQGLEYSLYDYEDAKRHLGWTSRETFGYSWKGVPRVMINLNQQRENFRDSFRNTCLVFLVPVFVKRYFIHRAPDFFDWRSGIFRFPMNETHLQEATQLAYVDERTEQAFKKLTPSERRNKILHIQALLDEGHLSTDEKARLYFERALLFQCTDELEAAIASYDTAIEFKPDDDATWYNRGIALAALGRTEEAIASYDT
ncbi:MAG: tetratricopeptide repeat protein, partial [Cyanobacteria bacterium J06633_2]